MLQVRLCGVLWHPKCAVKSIERKRECISVSGKHAEIVVRRTPENSRRLSVARCKMQSFRRYIHAITRCYIIEGESRCKSAVIFGVKVLFIELLKTLEIFFFFTFQRWIIVTLSVISAHMILTSFSGATIRASLHVAARSRLTYYLLYHWQVRTVYSATRGLIQRILRHYSLGNRLAVRYN